MSYIITRGVTELLIMEDPHYGLFTTVCKYVELLGLYLILLDDPGSFHRETKFNSQRQCFFRITVLNEQSVMLLLGYHH